MPCHFFKRSKASSQFALLSNPVSLNRILPTLEKFFGILNRKIGGLGDIDQLKILRKTGLTNVYGVTRYQYGHDEKVDENDALLKIDRLDEFKAFLVAENFADRKALFISHATGYINFQLQKHGYAADISSLQPVIDLLNQKFIEVAGSLPPQRKKIIKKRLPDATMSFKAELTSKRAIDTQAHLDKLRALSDAVTSLVLASITIQKAIDRFYSEGGDGFRKELSQIKDITLSDDLLDGMIASLETPKVSLV